AERDGAVDLWEVSTGGRRGQLLGHQGQVYHLAVSPDGRRLLSAAADNTALLWDLGGQPPPAGGKLPAADLDPLWRHLAAQRPAPASAALGRLAGGPGRRLPALRRRLSPVARVEPAAVARWLRDLGSERFAERQGATEKLDRAGEAAEAALRRSSADKTDLER